MSSHRIRSVFFDLDGTLIQTAQGFEKAFIDLGLEPEPFDGMANFLSGVDWRALIDYVFRNRQDDIHDIRIAFAKYHDEHMADLSSYYPHALETLLQLKKLGFTTGIISNKNHEQCLILNESFQFPVDFYMGSGAEIPFKKPHPAQLLLACKKLNLNPWECLYIGDMPTDLEAASWAGMTGVYARYGLHHHFNPSFTSKINIDCISDVFSLLAIDAHALS